MREQLIYSLLVFILTSYGCASQIPKTRGLKPQETAKAFDPKSIVFKTLGTTSSEESLSSYMEQNNLATLLLTFGSKGCAACGRKADQIQKKILGKHPFFLTEPGKAFGIVGINTDPEPERIVPFLRQYPFIVWSDPSGQVMLKHFMTPGESFRVPLTVLVSRTKILWRLTADEPMSMEEILAKVALTLDAPSPRDESRQLPPPPGKAPFPPSTPPVQDAPVSPAEPNEPLDLSRLEDPSPSRWKDLEVTDCGGQKRSLASLRQEPGLALVLQTVRAQCDAKCQSQHKALVEACGQNLGEASEEREVIAAGKRPACEVWTLVEPEFLVNGHDYGSISKNFGLCTVPEIIQGGKKIFETFGSLFDWKAPRSVDNEGYVKIEIQENGPWVLVFNEASQLLHEKEGYLSPEDLARLRSMNFPQHRGIDFPLLGSPNQTLGNLSPQRTSLAPLRGDFDLTVLAFFQTDCASCDDEFKKWSSPGGLMDFCAERNSFCQIFASEVRFRPSGWELDDFYRRVLTGYDDDMLGSYTGFMNRGIKIPLLLDPTPDDDGDDAFKNRLHDGYLIGISKELQFKYRKAVFDSEGKLRRVFVAPDDESSGKDPLETYLEEEFKRKSQRSKDP